MSISVVGRSKSRTETVTENHVMSEEERVYYFFIHRYSPTYHRGSLSIDGSWSVTLE